MKREQFIKLSAFGTLAAISFRGLAFNSSPPTLSYDELIGKGSPTLFGEGYKLRKEAYDAFILMKEAAHKNGINLKIVSSYRSFAHQNSIWERKYKLYSSQGFSPTESIQKIIDYSTIPGTSRHHWGTDIDLIDGNAKQPNNVLDPKNFGANACFRKFKQWMDDHSKEFGFYLVYTDASDRTGFKYEPWHYSFRPLSCEYLSEYKKLNLKQILQSQKLMGSDHFSEEFISKYSTEHILDINPELL